MVLLGEVLNEGDTLYDICVNGYTEETFESLLASVGGEVVYSSTAEAACRVAGGYAYVFREISGSGATIHVASVREDVVEAIAKVARLKIVARPPMGSIYVLVRGSCGFDLSPVGMVHDLLERGNYTREVLEQYDHVTECLNTDNPGGRLILLDGPPGTGKSHMIRGLASDVRAIFVVVSSSLVGQLSGPDVVPVLLRKKQEGESGPIVLILEDADAALVRRETGNLIGLGDVLNIGDGLLGELADLRIIATTNAQHVDLDPAILRPGRMCAHVRVGMLDPDTATAVYRRLTGACAAELPESSLAEVYRLARADGWKPDKSKPYRAGIYL